MGGWLIGMVASDDQALAGAVLISAVNMGIVPTLTSAGNQLEAQAAGNSEALAGTSPALQAADVQQACSAHPLTR